MRSVAFGLLFGLVGCSPPGDQGLAERIRAATDTSDVLDFEALAPFEWDRMVVAGPYTTKERFEAGGLDWPAHWKWSNISFKDDRAFLVFALEGEIVSAFDYFGSLGSYPCTQRRLEGIAPEDARFIVQDDGRVILEADARECDHEEYGWESVLHK